MPHPHIGKFKGRPPKVPIQSRGFKPSQDQRRLGVSDLAPSLLWHLDGRPADLRGAFNGHGLFLVLSGPSVAEAPLSRMEGLPVMCVNNSWSLIRPTLWTCVDSPRKFLGSRWMDPNILKMVPSQHSGVMIRSQDSDGDQIRDTHWSVAQAPNTYFYVRESSFDHQNFFRAPGVQWGCPARVLDSIGQGGTRSVMLAAIRLAHWLGFHRLYLVGADFKMPPTGAAYGFPQDKSSRARDSNNSAYNILNARLAALFSQKHPTQDGKSVFSVHNCTPGSLLTAVSPMDVNEALDAEWKGKSRGLSTRGWYD